MNVLGHNPASNPWSLPLVCADILSFWVFLIYHYIASFLCFIFNALFCFPSNVGACKYLIVFNELFTNKYVFYSVHFFILSYVYVEYINY